MSLSKEEAATIMHEVRENHKNLLACNRHIFKLHKDRPLNAKYKCTRCNGVVDSHAYFWYDLGVKHALAVEEKKENVE